MAEQNVREAYSTAADRLHLTDENRQELIPSGTQRLLDNRIGWAKTYLLKAGVLASPRRAFIRITSRWRVVGSFQNHCIEPATRDSAGLPDQCMTSLART